jgi:hypothetical protein
MKVQMMVGGLGALLVGSSVLAIPEGPAPNTPEWTQREMQNYARTTEGPNEQAQNPDFQTAWNLQSLSNFQEWVDRAAADPSWLGPPSGNSLTTPVATTYSLQATGDPTRYPAAAGPNGATFYDTEGEVSTVVYYDEGCARITGRVWKPRSWQAGNPTLPGVVIENGSIQAPQPLYWWFAQTLVRAGYVVMTFDPRGQGRSDQQTPDGEQGSNANSEVFFSGMVNAIDFFRSTPGTPYPRNVTCAGSYPTVVTPHNPFHATIDPSRLGIAGHSLGAAGVSAVQGYPGSRFAFPDGGGGNPVDVVIGWDSLGLNAEGPPRVPAMGQSSEYGIGGAPFTSPPDPESDKNAYVAYRDAGIPVYQLTIQGSTHFEWSLIPTFPSTSWCPDTSTGSCLGGWGMPMADHYSLAWMDRWLKQPGEPGYADADARLLADDDWCERYSFYLRSARAFPDRGNSMHVSEDIRADCLAAAGTTTTTTSLPGGSTTTTTLPSQDLNLTRVMLRTQPPSGARSGSVRIQGDFLVPPALTVPPPFSVRVRDSLGLDRTHTFATCTTRANGVVLCRESAVDGMFKAAFRPLRGGGAVRFSVTFQRQAITGPFAAPVTVAMTHNGGAFRAGTITDCQQVGSGLSCREF